jgi:hypothetical protein
MSGEASHSKPAHGLYRIGLHSFDMAGHKRRPRRNIKASKATQPSSIVCAVNAELPPTGAFGSRMQEPGRQKSVLSGPVAQAGRGKEQV